MSLVCETVGFPAQSGRDLEHVAKRMPVVSDHVEDVYPVDAHMRKIDSLPPFRAQFEILLHEPLREVPGAHAVCGEFLARQVNEPDVA